MASVFVSPKKIIIYQTDVAEQETYLPNISKTSILKDSFPVPYLFTSPNKTDLSSIQVKALKEKSGFQNSEIITQNVYVRLSLLKYASKINLNLLPDLHLVASRIKIDFRSEDDFTWFGTLNKSSEINTILTVKGQAVCGNITVDDKTYHISPISPPLHQISLSDYSKFPVGHSPIKIPQKFQKDIDENRSYERGDDGSNIHVMVLYTEKAANRSGNIHTLIQLAVDETNLSFEKSNVQTRLNIVHTHMVDYQEDNIIKDLENLTSKHDGFMDEIHDLRDQYCADIVVLIEDLNDYCGVSYLNADSEHAFCIVSKECATGYYSFGHEIGHLFGARHNPESDSDKIPYPYGHGYLHANGWRTIMAYNNSQICPNGICQRILRWSNPSIRYKSIYMGTFTTHNNARLLNEEAITLANFRFFGKGFAVNNKGDKNITLISVTPENEWIQLIQPPELPIDIEPTHSQSYKIKIDWKEIQSIKESNIWIQTLERKLPIQVVAIPCGSSPELSVTPTEIYCNKNSSMQTIVIDNKTLDNKNIKWRAFSYDPWLTVIDGYSGIGKGTVSLRIDNNLMGNRSGILNVTAIDAQWINQKVNIQQSGNQLSIELPQKAKENQIVLKNAGKISVPHDLTTPLRVQLFTSDASEVQVPEFVVIPENESHVIFDINIQDDSEPDGPQIVTIKGEANGWLTGESRINILDNEGIGGVIIVGPDEEYKNIQDAITDAAPGCSILVKSGHYNENLVILKNLRIYSENGAGQTFIHAKNSKKHVVEIHHSQTIIEGFSIVGSKYYRQAAIYLAETANNCLIKNNICGIDAQQNNYYGIYVDNSQSHTLSENTCQYNMLYGIYMDQTNENMLFKNTCQFNQKSGLFLLKSQNNIFCMNTLRDNQEYGLHFKQLSSHNQLFMNAFINNNRGHICSRYLKNFWQNTLPINFLYGRQRLSGFLGNYYDDHMLQDQNEDGIADEFYLLPGDEPLEEYPLAAPPDQYELSTLITDNDLSLNLNDMGKMQAQNSLASGQSLLFKSSLVTDFTWDMTKNDAWTGSIRLLQSLSENYSFKLEVGITDENGNFTVMGKPYEIIGDGQQKHLSFCFLPGDFSMPPGNWFGFQVTNSSPKDYTIQVGGGHTYISPYKHSLTNAKEWIVGQDAVFRTIQSALNFSKKGYTITVKPGKYIENIYISQPISLIAEKGYTQTIIAAKESGKNTINITSDNVLIRGFTVYGANNNSNGAGICIDRGAAHCRIENNRCGYDQNHANDYGIFIQSSMENDIINNRCIANKKHGIWIDTSFMNNFSQNFCYSNQAIGIFMNNSLYNHLEKNICENNGHSGIYLQKSSRNQLQFNIIDTNKKDGIYVDSDSTKNLIFLNNFVLNQRRNVNAHGFNRWHSSEEFIYKYQQNIFTGFLGNYYSDNITNDTNLDGKADTPYDSYGIDNADFYPLMQSFTAYEFINNNQSEHVVITQKQTTTESESITDVNKVNMVLTEPPDSFPEKILSPNIQIQKKDIPLNEKFSPIVHQEKKIQTNTIQPILVFTDIPSYGNRLKNLKGLLLNASPDEYHIAVYIHISETGWRTKPYKQNPMIIIESDGRWECDITTAPFDQNAIEVVAMLFNTDDMPPILMDAPVLPDSLFEKAVAVVRVSRDE